MVTVELMIVYLYLVCVVGSWLVVLAVYLFWVVCVCFKFGLLFVRACVGVAVSLSGVLFAGVLVYNGYFVLLFWWAVVCWCLLLWSTVLICMGGFGLVCWVFISMMVWGWFLGLFVLVWSFDGWLVSSGCFRGFALGFAVGSIAFPMVCVLLL